jgi:hypothetical protein
MSTTVRPLHAGLFLAGLMSLPMAFGQILTRDEYKVRETRIEAQFKADRSTCDGLAGNAKDICTLEAKGRERVAKAQLKADSSGKADDQRKLAEARADASYEVAKERCDDLAGNPKDVCVSDAKAARARGMADAKATEKSREARSEANQEKNDAAYDAARTRCDSLAGNAKDACVKDAKVRFNKG